MTSIDVAKYAAITLRVREVDGTVVSMSALVCLGIQGSFLKYARTVPLLSSCAAIPTLIANHGVIC